MFGVRVRCLRTGAEDRNDDGVNGRRYRVLDDDGATTWIESFGSRFSVLVTRNSDCVSLRLPFTKKLLLSLSNALFCVEVRVMARRQSVEGKFET